MYKRAGLYTASHGGVPKSVLSNLIEKIWLPIVEQLMVNFLTYKEASLEQL